MAHYFKEINRTLSIGENGAGSVSIVQRNTDKDWTGRKDDDIVMLDEAEAIEVYRFLHRKFGGQ
jgi:hypothetical protein